MTQEKHHWKASPNKNYLGEWDLPEKEELILTVKSAEWETVEDPTKRKDDPEKYSSKKVIRWTEGYKPLICNEENSDRIIKSTGKSYMEDTVGCKLALRRELWKDRRTKEEMHVVRVNPKPVKVEPLPKLTKSHKSWGAAHKAWHEGKQDAVKSRFDVSGVIKELDKKPA